MRSFGPKTAIFRPKQPQNPGETPKRRDTVTTLHVRLHFTVSESSLVPFNSTICPRNSPKRRQKAPKTAQCAPTPRNQARAVSCATWLKSEFRGRLVHPQAPTFCDFQASESPNEPLRPPYQWSLGGAGGQPGPRTVGANGGSTRVPGAKKIIFSKVVPRPLGKTHCTPMRTQNANFGQKNPSAALPLSQPSPKPIFLCFPTSK